MIALGIVYFAGVIVVMVFGMTNGGRAGNLSFFDALLLGILWPVVAVGAFLVGV